MAILSKSFITYISKRIGERIDDYSFFGKGQLNEIFLLSGENNQYILKIQSNSLFSNYVNEFSVLEHLEGHELSPTPILIDTSKTQIDFDYLIYIFVEGKILSELREDSFGKISSLMKEVHSYTFTSSNTILTNSLEQLNPLEIGDWQRSCLLDKSSSMDNFLKQQSIWIYNKAYEILKIYASPTPYLSGCHLLHGDVKLSNILERPDGKLVLIDWEFVTYGAPIQELATFSVLERFNRKDEDALINAYDPSINKSIHLFNALKIKRSLDCLSWEIQNFAAYKKEYNLNNVEFQEKIGDEMEYICAIIP